MIKNILWDFDGVILDSMPVREMGFRTIFKKFDDNFIDELIEYHNLNGGLSRYVKIRYFYEKILGINITDEEISNLANQFSTIMKKELINKKYLISETVDFIKENVENYNFHIVSGSDEKELKFLCKKLGILNYFISIQGSPTPKNELVQKLIKKFKYKKDETILVGDSLNDYEAAKINNIDFYGYNNEKVKDISNIYLNNYKDLKK